VKVVPVVICLVILVMGCATFNPKADEHGLLSLVDLMNRGKGSELSGLSSVPFLFDTEIVMLKPDIELLWKNIAGSGFTFKNPQVSEIKAIDDSVAALFSSTMDVKVFFKKYLPPNAMFGRVRTGGGDYLFVLGSWKNGYPVIYAFKGPVL
jgi:hypothetical protein